MFFFFFVWPISTNNKHVARSHTHCDYKLSRYHRHRCVFSLVKHVESMFEIIWPPRNFQHVGSYNDDLLFDQAPVVQRMDNAIHRINHYPLDSAIGFASVYPLDSDLSGG